MAHPALISKKPKRFEKPSRPSGIPVVVEACVSLADASALPFASLPCLAATLHRPFFIKNAPNRQKTIR